MNWSHVSLYYGRVHLIANLRFGSDLTTQQTSYHFVRYVLDAYYTLTIIPFNRRNRDEVVEIEYPFYAVLSDQQPWIYCKFVWYDTG